MTNQPNMRSLAIALAICAGLCNPVQAQSSVAGTVAAPMRADMTLNGTVADSRDSGDLATCHNLCRSLAGCTGFSFYRPARDAKSTCRRLTGTLTDAPQAGVVSCRMPCEPGARASVLPQKLPNTVLRDPNAALPAVARGAPPLPSPAPPPSRP